MEDFPITGGALTDGNGATLMLNKKAADALTKAARENPWRPLRASDRVPTATDQPKADSPLSEPKPLIVWYADGAKHPNAYIGVQFENNEVIVRDGNDPTGKALHFTREQWASYTDPDWANDADAEPEAVPVVLEAGDSKPRRR
jgi:hypothetical protein